MDCSQGKLPFQEPSSLYEFRISDMIQLEKDKEFAMANSDDVLFIQVSAEICEGLTVGSDAHQQPTHYSCIVTEISFHSTTSVFIIATKTKPSSRDIALVIHEYSFKVKTPETLPKTLHISTPHKSREILYYLSMIAKDSVFEEIRVSPFTDGICSEGMDAINEKVQEKLAIIRPRNFSGLLRVFRDCSSAICGIFEITNDLCLPPQYGELGTFLKTNESVVHCYNHFVIKKSTVPEGGVEIFAKVFSARTLVQLCENVLFKVKQRETTPMVSIRKLRYDIKKGFGLPSDVFVKFSRACSESSIPVNVLSIWTVFRC